MSDSSSARDLSATLCYGTLYERLCAALVICEDAVEAANQWNDYASMLGSLGVSEAVAMRVPSIEPIALQRRILAAYENHPLLDRCQPLRDVVAARAWPRGLEKMVATGDKDEALRQAAYIDRVRHDAGMLDVYRWTA